MKRKRLAIACQGGGSQCAFVAGALKVFFKQGIHRRFNIVGLSGTSGGAMTAALAWFGLLKQAQGDHTPIEDRIIACWNDLTAQTPQEILFDRLAVQATRLIEEGLVPSFANSPSSQRFQLGSKMVSSFSSVNGEISRDALLASAAIPNLFPAVWVDGHAYWDGIFSTNPPVVAFLQKPYMGKHAVPEEIWIIQVNRSQHETVPETPADIFDRRNHLAGNLSLQHELQLIELVNVLLREHALTDEFRAKVGLEATEPSTVRFIRMSEALQRGLDYPSKLSRQPDHIARLIADGEAQAEHFLASIGEADQRAEPSDEGARVEIN